MKGEFKVLKSLQEVFLGDCSVQLVLTSPPYWNITRYDER